MVERSLLTFRWWSIVTWFVSMRKRKICFLTMIKIDGGDFTALLSFPSFMILEPIEHVLALDLTVDTQLRRDLLNLIGARCS